MSRLPRRMLSCWVLTASRGAPRSKLASHRMRTARETIERTWNRTNANNGWRGRRARTRPASHWRAPPVHPRPPLHSCETNSPIDRSLRALRSIFTTSLERPCGSARQQCEVFCAMRRALTFSSCDQTYRNKLTRLLKSCSSKFSTTIFPPSR